MLVDAVAAERSVVGGIAIDARCLPDARRVIPSDEVFLSEDCASVFRAACQLADSGKPIDAVTLARSADVSNAFIADCMNISPTAAHVAAHAEIVVDGWKRRQLCQISETLTQEAGAPSVTVAEALTNARAALDRVAENRFDAANPADSLAAFMAYRAEIEEGKRRLVKTGFPSIDGILGGFSDGGLYVVGARTSVGKSAFAIALADMLAARGSRVLYVSLEMSAEEITARRVAAHAQRIKSFSRLLHGRGFDEAENADLAATAAALSERKFFITAVSSATVAGVGVMARNRRADVVVIDYLGLLSGKGTTEYDRVTQISGDLKRLARQLNCVVIALAQINREAMQGADNKPKLSQLKSSGAIEQDADAVFLLHRPDYGQQTERKPEEPLPFEVNIAKNRHGRVGAVTLQWYPACNRFTDEGKSGGVAWNVRSWKS